MHAVDDVVQPFSHARLRFVMENVSVDEVFEQRQEQDAEQEKCCDSEDRQSLPPQREVKHAADYREVEDQRRGGVNAREKFQEIALEHGDRLLRGRDLASL